MQIYLVGSQISHKFIEKVTRYCFE